MSKLRLEDHRVPDVVTASRAVEFSHNERGEKAQIPPFHTSQCQARSFATLASPPMILAVSSQFITVYRLTLLTITSCYEVLDRKSKIRLWH